MGNMGMKLSSNPNNPPRMRTFSASSPGSNSGGGGSDLTTRHGHSSQSTSRSRARSLGNENLNIPGASGGGAHSSSPDSDSSSPEDGQLPPIFFGGRPVTTHSLPVHLFAVQGIKCPVCSKQVPSDDIECHLVMCLTKPRVNYNEDVLTEDKGECVICFEELLQGDTIARLPCLCIYHKGCIDKWFQKNRSCPEHPSD